MTTLKSALGRNDNYLTVSKRSASDRLVVEVRSPQSVYYGSSAVIFASDLASALEADLGWAIDFSPKPASASRSIRVDSNFGPAITVPDVERFDIDEDRTLRLYGADDKVLFAALRTGWLRFQAVSA